MVAFAYDEFASGAPQWYGEVIAALAKEDVSTAEKLADEALAKKRELASLLATVAVKLELGAGAKPFADEAVEISKGKDKAVALHYRAKVLYQEKSYDDAEQAASEAIELYKSAGNKLGEASVLSTKAMMTIPASEKTLELANEALALFKEAKDTKGMASVLYTIIGLKLTEGKSNQALNVAEELVRVLVGASDSFGQALGLCKTAEIQMDLGALQEALGKASEAVELGAKLGDVKIKANSLNLVGKILGKAGMFDDANKAVNASLSLCRDSKDKVGQASALVMAASISAMHSEYSQAAYKLDKAAGIYKQLGDKRKEAQTLESLAQTQLKSFYNADDPSEPAALCEKAMKIYTELEMDVSPETGNCLQTFAFALLASDRKEECVEKGKEALSVFEELMDSAGEASALATLAQISWESKDKQEALRLAEKALSVAEQADARGEAEFARELVTKYGGSKISTNEAKGDLTAGQTSSSIYTYVYGQSHVLFNGFTMRGVVAPAAKAPKGSSSSKGFIEDEEPAGPTITLTYSLDFQSLS